MYFCKINEIILFLSIEVQFIMMRCRIMIMPRKNFLILLTRLICEKFRPVQIYSILLYALNRRVEKKKLHYLE